MAGLKDKARIEGVTSPVVPETLPELEKFIVTEAGEERLTMTGKPGDAVATLTKSDEGYFRIQRTADKTFVKSPRTGFPDFPNRGAAWKAYLEERKGGGLRDASLAEPSQRFIKSLEPAGERAARILKSRREAQVKRGRVGMPKNPPKIWKDIMEITGGVGMRPMFTSTGAVAEEYLVNVPKFMKNKNGKPPDEIIDALERDYGYTFVEEDMWSLLSKARYETPGDYGDEGPIRPGHPDPEAIEAELARQKKEYAPLMKEGETLDAFLGRMAQDAAEDGFGTRPEDVDEYISQMIKNKKGGGEPEGGAPTEAVPFEVAEKPTPYKKVELDIAGEVQRLTSGDFFPKEWQGNTDVEIQDNRQNLFRFVWENYTPDKGPLENYINANKGFFIRGESGRKGLTKLKREQQFPKTVTGGEKDFGEDKSVFGPESQPKGKKPPEPEIPGDSMKPDVFGAEEIRVMNALRSTAQAYTKSLGEAPGFEDKAVDILKSRLLASTPESFRSIGERLKYSKSYVKKQYDAMLEILKDSPAIKEIMARRMVQLNMGPLPSEQDLKHLAKMLRKYFSSYRGADKNIDQQNDRRIGGPMAEIFDQTIDASKINKWLKDQPEGTNEFLAQLMRGTMSGDGMEDIRNSALPEDIKEAMLNTRGRVDRLSDLVITHGGLAEETRAAFENNLGRYLAKAYRLYQDKHWSPTDAQKDAFKRWLMNEYTMTPEQADEFIEAELAYGRNDEGIRPQR
ncbi:MAG TPA: hypothetical protein VMV44_16580, partial [Rectinemataceae bacterium]|nr:hypothetical protein [Rectinemataceae bacterium]